MADIDQDSFTVGLKRRETEAGWLRLFDWFYITITPAWFSWLGWVAALSGLQFVAVKTHSAWARLAWNISNFLIFMYFAALFGRLRIFGVPGIKSDKAIRFVSILVSGLLAWLAAMASIKVAEAFGQSTP